MMRPSSALDHIYSGRHCEPSAEQDGDSLEKAGEASDETVGEDDPEKVLMTQQQGREVAGLLGVPQLGVELERAIYQVGVRMRDTTKRAGEGGVERTVEQEEKTSENDKTG